MSVFQNQQGVVAQTSPGGPLEGHKKYLNPKIIFEHKKSGMLKRDNAWDLNFYMRAPAHFRSPFSIAHV